MTFRDIVWPSIIDIVPLRFACPLGTREAQPLRIIKKEDGFCLAENP